MPNPSNADWIDIAIANIRNDIADLRKEIDKLHTAQEEWAKKEYAARIIGRIAHRAIRITWYAVIALGGYALTNWAKIKAFIEGK